MGKSVMVSSGCLHGINKNKRGVHRFVCFHPREAWQTATGATEAAPQGSLHTGEAWLKFLRPFAFGLSCGGFVRMVQDEDSHSV